MPNTFQNEKFVALEDCQGELFYQNIDQIVRISSTKDADGKEYFNVHTIIGVFPASKTSVFNNLKFYCDFLSEAVFDFDEILKKRIVELDLSPRCQNCLKSRHVYYLGDLVYIPEHTLYITQNFGDKTMQEVKSLLKKHGLKLNQTLPKSWFHYRALQNLPNVELTNPRFSTYNNCKPV